MITFQRHYPQDETLINGLNCASIWEVYFLIRTVHLSIIFQRKV